MVRPWHPSIRLSSPRGIIESLMAPPSQLIQSMSEPVIFVHSCAFCGEGVDRIRPAGGQLIIVSGDGRQLNFSIHLACLGAGFTAPCRATLEEYAQLPLPTRGD